MISCEFGWVIRLNQLLCLLLVLCPLQSQGHSVHTIHVRSNMDSFAIKLPANPSTGFEWTIQYYDKTILTLQKQAYQAIKTARIGAGGEMIYCFARTNKALNSTSTTIIFRNARSWEPASSGILYDITVIFD